MTGFTRPYAQPVYVDSFRRPRRFGSPPSAILTDVLSAFLIEDVGEGWWHCPSPLRCEVLDGPASHPTFMTPAQLWLVRTDPEIEWNGDESYIRIWGPDHPLVHPMEPTPFALVAATGREPPFAKVDPALLDGGIAACPVVPSPAPASVADASGIGGLCAKVDLRALP